MSTWRRLALELFPEYRIDIENGRLTFSIYQLLFDLLPLTHEAHRQNNLEFLKRVYQFAEWCWEQKRADDIYNAVCVAFYEHLVDSNPSLNAIPLWIKPKIFEDIKELFKSRMSENQYKSLLKAYNTQNKTSF